MGSKETPSYSVHYDIFNRISSIVYDGREYRQDEIVKLGATEDSFYVRNWRKKNPSEKYPWKLQGEERYLTINPRGSGDHNIHRARTELENELRYLKATVSPEHPYTLRQFEVHNASVLSDDLLSELDGEYLNEHGWESFEDADIVLIQTSWCPVPEYAILLPKPGPVRKERERVRVLRRLVNDFADAVYLILDSEGIAHDLEECGYDSEQYKIAARILRDLQGQLENDYEAEKAAGR